MDKYYHHFNDIKALIGRRVQIVNVSVKSYESFDLRARFGIIENYRYTQGLRLGLTAVAIKIVGTALNPKSKTGVFWLPPEDIELIDMPLNKNNFERNNIMEPIYVKVINPSNKEESYVTGFEKFEPNDMVVVDYQYGDGTLSVRKVLGIVSARTPMPVAGAIVGKVDHTVFDRVIEKQLKRHELEAKLRARATEREEEMMWRILAEHDPEMAELLRAYDEVQ